jgi:hypothetical protein
VFVLLISCLVPDRSPVTNEPAPANVFDVLLGLIWYVSPKFTIELGPTVMIFTLPTIDGMVDPSRRMISHLMWGIA